MAAGARPMTLFWTLLFVVGSMGLKACDEPAPLSPTASVADVKVGGRLFKLDIAADSPTRTKGLGGRAEIAADGGMIFVFPPSQVGVHEFVMRDCPVDIDIVFLDGAGRVLAMHEMKAERPRGEGEGKAGDLDFSNPANAAYDNRLRKYPSKGRATFAVELKGGTLRTLSVKEGDMVEFDAAGLKKRAR